MRQHLALFLPALLVAVISIVIPLMVAVIVPHLTGERLSDSSDFEVALEMYKKQPELRTLDPEGAIQAFIFQYFLVIFTLVPVTVAMSVAAHGIIGEKQARALEPLLATPITTLELVVAKILGAFVPALALSFGCFAAYLAVAAIFAEPGVAGALLTTRPLGVVLLMGPMASLMALTLAVCVSSRVNDARSAQQLAALWSCPSRRS